jgi:hypothetical protein
MWVGGTILHDAGAGFAILILVSICPANHDLHGEIFLSNIRGNVINTHRGIMERAAFKYRVYLLFSN